MGTSAYFYHSNDALQSAVKFDVTLHDDCIGQKGRAVRTEAQIGVTVFQFRRHQDSDPFVRQRRHQTQHRFAEILAKRRCQSQLKARERIDDDAGGVEAPNFVQQQQQYLVNGQVQRAGIDQRNFSTFDQVGDEAFARPARVLFKRGDDTGFTVARPFDQKRCRHDALAGTGRTGNQQRISPRQAATEHLVKPWHAHLQARIGRLSGLGRAAQGCRTGRRVDGDAGRTNAKGIQAGERWLSPHFDDFYFTHYGISFDALTQPDQPVGDGKHRVMAGIGLGFVKIFTDQKRGGLPGRHQSSEGLQEFLYCFVACAGMQHRSKGINEHVGGSERFNFGDNARKQRIEVIGQRFVGQINEAHRVVDHLDVEKRELLLMAQHFQRWLRQHRQVERGSLRRGDGKHDLMRQRRFSAARLARNQVERKFRQSAAEDIVQSRHAGRQRMNGHVASHGEVSCAG